MGILHRAGLVRHYLCLWPWPKYCEQEQLVSRLQRLREVLLKAMKETQVNIGKEYRADDEIVRVLSKHNGYVYARVVNAKAKSPDYTYVLYSKLKEKNE